MKNTLLFSLLLLASLSLISAVPMVPTVFSGTVSYSVSPSLSLQGHNINVSIGSSSVTWKVGTVGINNIFEVDVDPMGVSGVIHFYIGDVETVETGTYAMGAFVPLNLTIGSLPSGSPSLDCGDLTCNNGETCSTCNTDCGVCDDDDDDDNGNGGGGGGGSSSGGRVIVLDSGSDSNDNTPTLTGASVSNYDGLRRADTKEEPSTFMQLLSSGALLGGLIVFVIILAIVILITPKR